MPSWEWENLRSSARLAVSPSKVRSLIQISQGIVCRPFAIPTHNRMFVVADDNDCGCVEMA
jgi:hypothetical protein